MLFRLEQGFTTGFRRHPLMITHNIFNLSLKHFVKKSKQLAKTVKMQNIAVMFKSKNVNLILTGMH
jgi:hypothetical protein